MDMFCDDMYRESPAGVRKMVSLNSNVDAFSGFQFPFRFMLIV